MIKSATEIDCQTRCSIVAQEYREMFEFAVWYLEISSHWSGIVHDRRSLSFDSSDANRVETGPTSREL